MEYFNKILCVTYAELTGGGEAIIKGDTLLKNVTRGISSAFTAAVARVVRHFMHGVPFRRNTGIGIWNVTATLNRR